MSCGSVDDPVPPAMSFPFIKEGKWSAITVDEQPKIRVCPECGSGFIGEFKAGTQQIEDGETTFPTGKSPADGYGYDEKKKKDAYKNSFSICQ